MLVTPEKLMKRGNVDSPRNLAMLIHKKLQIELDPNSETHSNYIAVKSDLFLLSFYESTDAHKIEQDLQKRLVGIEPDLKITGEPEFRYLPPLFLLSDERFMICLDDILLVAFASGPIIPVVLLQNIREKNILEQLIFLYSKSSSNFVNLDTARSILTPK